MLAKSLQFLCKLRFNTILQKYVKIVCIILNNLNYQPVNELCSYQCQARGGGGGGSGKGWGF